MHDIPISNVRNFVIVGHSGSGKTSLTDALAYKLGLNDRLGSPAAGSSVSDFTDEEKNRKISIFSASFQTDYAASDGSKYDLFFTDTPGFMDFHGQMMAAARAADTALCVVDASGGVQVGTRRAWKCADQQGVVARAIAVTGLDKDNTSLATALESVQAAFGDKCVPVAFLAADKKSVVSVLAANVPADMADDVAAAKQKLVELAAEQDEALMEKYFSEGALSDAETAAGLLKAAAAGTFVPVMPVLPLSGGGVPELLEVVCRYFASPLQRVRNDAEGKPIDPAANRPFLGLVWRTVSDAFVGQMSYVRVLAGTLKTNSEVENPRAGEKEKVGALLIPCGKKQNPVETATAGDIVAIPKLKSTKVGDTLCAIGAPQRAAPLVFPNAVMFAAVTAKSQADDDKLGPALQRIVEQDPTLHFERNAETHETVLRGLGDVHLDVACSLMKSLSNVNVTLSTPKVAYRETVTGVGEGHYRHKKQSGGRGQFGEVYLKVERRPEGDDEWFVDDIVGGSIPGNFLPAIQKGLVEAMLHGSVAGYPVVNIRARIYDGSYHDVDSSEIAFKIAGGRAFRDGMAKAKPVLLEPIMTVRVTIPDHFMGPINGDLTHKRGRVLGMDNDDGLQVVIAEVPQAELFRYAAELRSITGGQGSFSMEFNRYEVVPSNVAQKVIAESPYQHHDEE
jgi:elongation factor G